MNKKNVTEHFTFAQWLDKAMQKHPDRQNCASCTQSESWAGPHIERARDLAVNGWPEGFERMQAILQKLESDIRFPSMQEKITSEVIGSSPDIGAYLRGEPECMFQIESMPSFDRKFARIHISGAMSAATATDAIFWRGATVIALAHALEQAGFGTEITLDYTTRGPGGPDTGLHFCQIIALKSAGQPIDTNRITYMLANNSAFRRLGFSVMEHQPAYVRNAITYYTGGNYGMPVSMLHPHGADIHFEINTSPIFNQMQAAAHVKHLLTTLPQLIEANQQTQPEQW